MKRSVIYPDWAEKCRGKGRTLRKVRDGYYYLKLVIKNNDISVKS